MRLLLAHGHLGVHHQRLHVDRLPAIRFSLERRLTCRVSSLLRLVCLLFAHEHFGIHQRLHGHTFSPVGFPLRFHYRRLYVCRSLSYGSARLHRILSKLRIGHLRWHLCLHFRRHAVGANNLELNACNQVSVSRSIPPRFVLLTASSPPSLINGRIAFRRRSPIAASRRQTESQDAETSLMGAVSSVWSGIQNISDAPTRSSAHMSIAASSLTSEAILSAAPSESLNMEIASNATSRMDSSWGVWSGVGRSDASSPSPSSCMKITSINSSGIQAVSGPPRAMDLASGISPSSMDTSSHSDSSSSSSLRMNWMDDRDSESVVSTISKHQDRQSLHSCSRRSSVDSILSNLSSNSAVWSDKDQAIGGISDTSLTTISTSSRSNGLAIISDSSMLDVGVGARQLTPLAHRNLQPQSRESAILLDDLSPTDNRYQVQGLDNLYRVFHPLCKPSNPHAKFSS